MKKRSFFRYFTPLFRVLDILRRVILGIVFLLLLVALIRMLLPPPSVKIRPGTVLEIRPYGQLVEVHTRLPNYLGIPFASPYPETLLDDMVRSLRYAAQDPNIEAVWLDLSFFSGGGPASLGEFSQALEEFRQGGKPLYASADTFDDPRYYLAAGADRIYLDRLGEVFPQGYGVWRAYLAQGLQRFGVKTSLFRSGESKSAGEIFTRSGPSEEAQRDEARLLGDLWGAWLDRVSRARNLNRETLETWIENYAEVVEAAGNNASQAAREARLVDYVEDGGELLENHLKEITGDDPKRRVEVLDYLWTKEKKPSRGSLAAVLPIQGPMVYGEGRSGEAGSDILLRQMDLIRENPHTAALILRINTPGGDVRAAEAVRREVQKIREDLGIPVIASLGSVAASGGYWVALEADHIVTNPESITGSIGVFSLAFSFEEALDQWLGIKIDGMGTTPWSGMGHPGRTLSEDQARLYRAGVADVDQLFQNLVVEKRGLAAQEVSRLAGGIPWSGQRAVTLGLADGYGGLNQAVEEAEKRADEKFERVVWFEETPGFWENLLMQLLENSSLETRRERGGAPLSLF